MRPRKSVVSSIVIMAGVLSVLMGVSLAQTARVIYKFNGTVGANPADVNLAQGRDGQLYGVTLFGGLYSQGAVFKLTPSGQVTALHSFNGNDGAYPVGGLTLGPDGNFYGTTEGGGIGGGGLGDGVLFRMTPTGNITVLHDFVQNGTDGYAPQSPPILASDGNFYGATVNGGLSDAGTIYKVIPSTGAYSIIFSYDFTNGSSAFYSPTQGSDGSLYVVAQTGGNNGCGSLIKVSTSGVLSNTYSFDCSASGGGPIGSLLQGSDGNLYGTTSGGGAYSGGVLFKLSTNFEYSVLYSFGATSTDGRGPAGAVIQAVNGDFYGVDSYGGSFAYGATFKYSLRNGYKTVTSWNRQVGASGGLLQHTNGMFYGTTYLGGYSGLTGTVYGVDDSLGPFVVLVQYQGKVGTTAQILGQGFTGTTSVTFNGVPAAHVTAVSDTYLTAVVPAYATSGAVVVATSKGTMKSNRNFSVIQ